MLKLYEFRWYAIRTQSHCEKVVRDELMSRGIECLLPMRTRMSQWKDRHKWIEWPLFSGYCFGLFAHEERRHVLHASGVVEIMGRGHVAEPLPEHEIAALLRLMQAPFRYDAYPYHVQEGMMVTVIRGPLQGLNGRFVRTVSSCRFIVAVNLIQQAAAVEIAAEDVTPIEHQPNMVCHVP